MRKLLILGAGGYGKTVADVAAQLGYDHIRFLDDSRNGETILGKCEDYARFVDSGTEIYPAFGHNGNRMMWLETFLENININILSTRCTDSYHVITSVKKKS